MSIPSDVITPTEPAGKEDIYDLLSPDVKEDDEKLDLSKKEKSDEKSGRKDVKELKEDEEEDKGIDPKKGKEGSESKNGEAEKDELAELEAELEEPSEDKLELVTPVRRREILAKYPNVFKDFPYLEKAYYREQKFTEIYPTIEDAETAKTKSDTLDNFEAQLLKGDLSDIVKAVKEESKESFDKLVDNYLVTLGKIDEPAYHHIIANVIKSTIYNMVTEAKNMSQEQGEMLQSAAQILNQYVFGTSKYTAPQQLSKEETKNDKEKALEEREKNFTRARFEDARDRLGTRVDNTLKNTISSHIDPKDSMTPYVKRNAEREAMETIYDLLGKDSRFNALKDKLWENAHKHDFNADSMDKIKSAILARAKSLLPTVIQKARSEALKGMGKRVAEEETEEKEEEKTEVRRSTSSSRQNSGQSTSGTKKGKIPEGMSSKDYIMSDL